MVFAQQGKKDIAVLRFIIEYISFRDFGPNVIIVGLFLYEDLLKDDIFWLVLKLEISYQSYNILKGGFGFF